MTPHYVPELGLNVVDLGLIYDVQVQERTVDVTMTMTTRGCLLHDAINGGVQAALALLPGVQQARVHVVWDPPWHPGRMSEVARRELWG